MDRITLTDVILGGIAAMLLIALVSDSITF